MTRSVPSSSPSVARDNVVDVQAMLRLRVPAPGPGEPVELLDPPSHASLPSGQAWRTVCAAIDDAPLIDWCRTVAHRERTLAWWAYDEAARRAENDGLAWTPALAWATAALDRTTVGYNPPPLEAESPEGRCGPDQWLPRIASAIAALDTAGDWTTIAPLVVTHPTRRFADLCCQHLPRFTPDTVARLVALGCRDGLARNPVVATDPAASDLVMRAALVDLLAAEDRTGDYQAVQRQGTRRIAGLTTVLHLLATGWICPPATYRRLVRAVWVWRAVYQPDLTPLTRVFFDPRMPPLARRPFRVLVQWLSARISHLTPEGARLRQVALQSRHMTPALFYEWGRRNSGLWPANIRELLNVPAAMQAPLVRRLVVAIAAFKTTLLPELPPEMCWAAIEQALDTRRRTAAGEPGIALKTEEFLEALYTVIPVKYASIPQCVYASLLEDHDAEVRCWALQRGAQVETSPPGVSHC